MANETSMQLIEQSARNAMLGAVVIEMTAGVLLMAAGIGVYCLRLRNAQEKQTLLWIVAVIATVLGLFFFVWGAFSLVNYLTAPVIFYLFGFPYGLM